MSPSQSHIRAARPAFTPSSSSPSSPSSSSSSPPSSSSSALRLAAFLFALGALLLLPFLVWGSAMDRAAPAWLTPHAATPWLAALGVALLVADVVAPVPSSLVCVALCVSLGPVRGGLVVAAGTLAAFAAGYALGRLLPEPRLRAWIGAALWDRSRLRARRHALLWIAVSRPLPLLAEVTALLAGAWRVPPAAALAAAAAASSLLGLLYAATTALATTASSGAAAAPPLPLTLALLLALPAASWLVHRIALPRAPRSPLLAQPTPSQSHDQEVS